VRFGWAAWSWNVGEARLLEIADRHDFLSDSETSGVDEMNLGRDSVRVGDDSDAICVSDPHAFSYVHGVFSRR